MPLDPKCGQPLAAGAIVVTHRRCDPALTMLERAFLVGLHAPAAWRRDGTGSLITGITGPMRFHGGL